MQWQKLLDRIGDISEIEHGATNNRSKVERMKRRKDEW